MRPGYEEGGTGKVTEQDHADVIRYWQAKTPAERFQAILEIRDFYYEVMHPGTGAKRLDRTIGGTRSLRG